jgi:hypothetical protein
MVMARISLSRRTIPCGQQRAVPEVATILSANSGGSLTTERPARRPSRSHHGHEVVDAQAVLEQPPHRLDVVADGGDRKARAVERLGVLLGLEERPFPNSSVMIRKCFFGSSARPSPISQSYPSLWAM